MRKNEKTKHTNHRWNCCGTTLINYEEIKWQRKQTFGGILLSLVF